jgi:uncharacterized repeat protein (TIGR01451 family)
MRNRLTLALLLPMLLILGGNALAVDEPSVTITTKAVIEKKVATPEGRLEIKRFPADEVLPGTTVIFVNTVTNNSTGSAEGITVTNPVPENMSYIDSSSAGAETIRTFSVDGGKSFELPGKLTIPGPNGKPRPAISTDYTDIRWQFTQPMPAKTTEQIEFQAKVK